MHTIVGLEVGIHIERERGIYPLFVSSFQAIVCIPDMSVIQVLQKLAWVAAAGFAAMSHAQLSEVHASFEKVGTWFCLSKSELRRKGFT